MVYEVIRNIVIFLLASLSLSPMFICDHSAHFSFFVVLFPTHCIPPPGALGKCKVRSGLWIFLCMSLPACLHKEGRSRHLTFYLFIYFYQKNVLIDFRERGRKRGKGRKERQSGEMGGGREGWRERNIDLLFYLLVHSVVASCMSPAWGLNPHLAYRASHLLESWGYL